MSDSNGILVHVQGVDKTFHRGSEEIHVLAGLDLEVPAGRVPRADGAVRLGQDHAAESDRRPRPARPPGRWSIGGERIDRLSERGSSPPGAPATSASSSSSTTCCRC